MRCVAREREKEGKGGRNMESFIGYMGKENSEHINFGRALEKLISGLVNMGQVADLSRQNQCKNFENMNSSNLLSKYRKL